jgi:hypothetical protein
MTLEQAYFITQILVGFGFIISIIFFCGADAAKLELTSQTNGQPTKTAN